MGKVIDLDLDYRLRCSHCHANIFEVYLKSINPHIFAEAICANCGKGKFSEQHAKGG